MPKVPDSAELPEYAPVASRILLFRERYPEGRIETQLVRRTAEEVIFRAAVYRHIEDRRPAATGWAAEREGDGEVNTVACLENTETSAIGRALANLGFTAAKQRPSAEEMAKVARVRARPSSPPTGRALNARLQARADAVMEALRLVDDAERTGMRPSRAKRYRERLVRGHGSPETAARVSELLRRWIEKRRDELLPITP